MFSARTEVFFVNISSFFTCIFLIGVPILFCNSPYFSPQTVRQMWILLFTPILLLCFTFLLNNTWKSSVRIELKFIDISFFLYCLYLIVQNMFILKTNHYRSLCYENLYLLILYFTIRVMPDRYSRRIISCLVYTAIIQTLIGILQYVNILPSLNDSFIITGTFSNPAPFSGYLAVLLPVVLGNLPDKEYHLRKVKFLRYILPTAVIAVIVAAKSRAALISMIIGCIYLFFQTSGKSNIKWINGIRSWSTNQGLFPTKRIILSVKTLTFCNYSGH